MRDTLQHPLSERSQPGSRAGTLAGEVDDPVQDPRADRGRRSQGRRSGRVPRGRTLSFLALLLVHRGDDRARRPGRRRAVGGRRPEARQERRPGRRVEAARRAGRWRRALGGRRLRPAPRAGRPRRRALRRALPARPGRARPRRAAGGGGDAAPGARALARPGARGRERGALRAAGDRAARGPAARLPGRSRRRRPGRAAGTRRSPASSRHSCGSIRCASGSAASRCSPSTAPGVRPTPSRHTAAPTRRSSTGSASSRRRSCGRSRPAILRQEVPGTGVAAAAARDSPRVRRETSRDVRLRAAQRIAPSARTSTPSRCARCWSATTTPAARSARVTAASSPSCGTTPSWPSSERRSPTRTTRSAPSARPPSSSPETEQLPFGLRARCGVCTGEVVAPAQGPAPAPVIGEAVGRGGAARPVGLGRRDPDGRIDLAPGAPRRARIRASRRRLPAPRHRRRCSGDPAPARPAARRPRARRSAACARPSRASRRRERRS